MAVFFQSMLLARYVSAPSAERYFSVFCVQICALCAQI